MAGGSSRLIAQHCDERLVNGDPDCRSLRSPSSFWTASVTAGPFGRYMLGCLTLAAAACQTEPSILRPFSLADSTARLAPDAESAPDSLELRYVSNIGRGVLRGVGAVAVSRNGLIAAYEVSECSVALIEEATGALRRRVGRCGDGPEEFRRVTSMVFIGDTLYVADATRYLIHVLNGAGEFVRTIQPNAVADRDISYMTLGGFTATNRLTFDASEHRTHNRYVVGMMDTDSGSVVARIGTPPTALTQDTSIADLTGMHCAIRSGGESRIVVANPWQFEAVAFDTAGAQRWRSFTALPWLHPQGEGAEMEPLGVVRSPVCGDQVVMLRAMTAPFRSRAVDYFNDGWIEFRTYDGRPVFSLAVRGGDPRLWGARAATQDNRWYFMWPNDAEPSVTVYELVPRAAGRPAVTYGRPDA